MRTCVELGIPFGIIVGSSLLESARLLLLIRLMMAWSTAV